MFNELTVFNVLDKLKCTAAGEDELPYWFLKIAAFNIAMPLTHMFNLSMSTGIIPSQFKRALIKPIPKINLPKTHSDYRPISLTPILSRILDKLVVKYYLYPLFYNPLVNPTFSDQFAFRPSGSTQAALISIIHHITHLLATNCYVRIIALDFTKAFDTVRHATILTKLAKLPVCDQIYNWFIDYFQGHSHTTRFLNQTSNRAYINASVFQGSAIGPIMYAINCTDLKPRNKNNFIDKYADDSYLIVPYENEHTLGEELQGIEEWAMSNNLSLNKNKSKEMVFFSSNKKKEDGNTISPVQDIPRVKSLKILGVTIQDRLIVTEHVKNVCDSAAQSLYALKLIKSRGLDAKSLQIVGHAVIISRLTYAAPAWWGFTNANDKQVIQAIINRAKRWGHLNISLPTIEQICEERDKDLFKKIISNPYHVLQTLLPEITSHAHSLRSRSHNRQLTHKISTLVSKSFITRMLFKDTY